MCVINIETVNKVTDKILEDELPISHLSDFVCEQCGKNFLSEGGLKYHMKTSHSDGVKNFHCSHCTYSAITQGQLTAHLRIRHRVGKNVKTYQVS